MQRRRNVYRDSVTVAKKRTVSACPNCNGGVQKEKCKEKGEKVCSVNGHAAGLQDPYQ